MTPPAPSVETILTEAVALPDPADRAAYLDRVCDPALRGRIERLVADHFRAGSFLERPPVVVDTDETVSFASAGGDDEGPGAVIGPYKLLERIGEGGMGAVYVAEQHHPVRRKVALKVIKPGMDSRQVVARFEQERQALALMDHPHIARVLDGGTTATGRPYFVMELVRGLPVTAYCDQAKLPIPDRLRLFADVCRAVQHAHQKGVIHRDLKPSNVLVTVIDGRPVPKVIDFGIAKATGGALTDRTLHTGFHQLVGTPLYMAPEQAELSGVDVDTRADVYSLGVLLYELLTGTTPFDGETLRKAGFDEMRRIIREDEPARPSKRVSTLQAGRSATVAAGRGVDPRRLGRVLRGELDWVVMRCLDKDRNRRYQSPAELAADVERYLDGRPVEAVPASGWYRLRKFIRRNRAALLTTGLVAATLIAGTGVSVWQMVLARQAEASEAAARAREEERAKLAQEVIQEFYRKVAGEWLTGDAELEDVQREFLEKAVRYSTKFLDERPTDPKARLAVADTLLTVANIENGLGRVAEAEPHYLRAIEEFDTVWNLTGDPAALLGRGTARQRYGSTLYKLSRPESEQFSRLGLADAEAYLETFAQSDPGRKAEAQLLSAWCAEGIGAAQLAAGKRREAEKTFRERLAANRRLLVAYPNDSAILMLVGGSHHNLAEALSRQGQFDEAIRAEEDAVETYSRIQPRKKGVQADLARSYRSLGAHLAAQDLSARSEKAYQESVRLSQVLADAHPSSRTYRRRLAESTTGLAGVIAKSRSGEDSLPVYQQAVRLWEQCLAEEPTSETLRRELGDVLGSMGTTIKGNPMEAELVLRRSEALLREVAEQNPSNRNKWQWATALTALGNLLKGQGRTRDAEPILTRAVEVREAIAQGTPTDVLAQSNLASSLHNLATCLTRDDQYESAIELLERAVRVQQAALDARPQLSLARTNLRNHHVLLATCLVDHPDPDARKPAEAVRHARRAIELKPDDSWYSWNYLGLAQYRAGDWDAAITAFQASAKQRSTDEESACRFRYLQALAYHKAGRRAEAAARLTEAEKMWEAVRNREGLAPAVKRTRAEAVAVFGETPPAVEMAPPRESLPAPRPAK